jgi:hypothetical protein
MTKGPRDFPGQAFLELLRPPKLARTRFALFASYSADPIVLGGALLHLHARGRDNGGGNKSDFASAVEALRHRVRFVVQRGRIHRGRKLPKIAAVLDQFVVEMPYPERDASWHPKLAIICYEGAQSRRTWRLWIGSRNLTLARDIDLGLTLDGEARRRKGCRAIEGVDAMGAELARQGALPGIDPDQVAEELRLVRWAAPEGIDVSELRLWTKGDQPAPPFAPDEERKLVVFSPFLCNDFVATLAGATARSADRTLVTTLPAVRKLRPESRAKLAGFKLLSLSAPAPEGEASRDDAPAQHGAALEGEDADGAPEAHHAGLHAKLYAAIGGGKVDIVAGSANASRRAWSGRNAEAVARFSGGKAEIDGINAIVGSAFPIGGALLESLIETEADVAEQDFERTRWRLVELPFQLLRQGKGFTLACDPAPSIPAHARLEVGLATMTLIPWPAKTPAVELGEVPLSLQTDLVQFRLSSGELPPACWLQRIAVSPAIEGDRDSAAISRLLSVSGLQAWLRAILEGEAAAGAEDEWDADGSAGVPAVRQSWKHDGFALEDILSAWARSDLEKLKQVDRLLDRYVAAVLAHSEHLLDQDRKGLGALQATWKVARDVLLARR